MSWFDFFQQESCKGKETSVEARNANCSARAESWHKLGVNLFKAHDIVMNSGFAWLWGRNCIYQVTAGYNIQLLILASAIVDEAHTASSFTLWKQQQSSSGVGSNPCRTGPWKERKKERRKEVHYVGETASPHCWAHRLFDQVNHKLRGGEAEPFKFYSHINNRWKSLLE